MATLEAARDAKAKFNAQFPGMTTGIAPLDEGFGVKVNVQTEDQKLAIDEIDGVPIIIGPPRTIISGDQWTMIL